MFHLHKNTSSHPRRQVQVFTRERVTDVLLVPFVLNNKTLSSPFVKVVSHSGPSPTFIISEK